MTSKPADSAATTFRDMGLPEPILKTLIALGYETPSPIQASRR
ncbi:MAG: hypothetical protein RIS14_1336 [Pseudomonadota bacterium]